MLKLILSLVKILIVFICLSMNIHVVHDRILMYLITGNYVTTC